VRAYIEKTHHKKGQVEWLKVGPEFKPHYHKKEVALSHRMFFTDEPWERFSWCLLPMTWGSRGSLACLSEDLLSFLLPASPCPVSCDLRGVYSYPEQLSLRELYY
jgi:hypothetical protein